MKLKLMTWWTWPGDPTFITDEIWNVDTFTRMRWLNTVSDKFKFWHLVALCSDVTLASIYFKSRFWLHYMGKSLWTPDNHTHLWFLTKPLPKTCKHTILLNVVICYRITVSLSGITSPNMFQHGNATCTIHEAKKRWFAMVEVKKLEWPAKSPDLNPTEHFQDESEHWLHPRSGISAWPH